MNGQAACYTNLAASYGQLGQDEEARNALEKARELRPALHTMVPLALFATADQDLRDRYLEGFRIAGLEDRQRSAR